MIIETRYRDLSWEEIAQHVDADESAPVAWPDMRGRPVSIVVPVRSRILVLDPTCEGPFFDVADGSGVVCAHVVEIGD